MTTRLRNASACIFMLSAVLLFVTTLRANPFENYCNNVISTCQGYQQAFSECSASCQTIFNDCVSWCGEVSSYPISFGCDPEVGTPTGGHCNCSGDPCSGG
jgi:hypothetical protein